MPNTIQGRYTFQLHGTMQARNVRIPLPGKPAHPYDKNQRGAITAGVADPALLESVVNIELPVMTAFFPLEYPDGTPNRYTPNTGFYPYAEQGTLDFASDGSALADFRLNVAGASTDILQFHGHYAFDVASAPPGPGAPSVQTNLTGVLTLQGVANATLVWDYAFAFINKNDALLMSLGRLPRPASLTGRMWKIWGA